ncbi:hypothetical protein B0T14DRAFT_565388 [Immersiella caudata]|uniref:Uncharacterized protein n=1 Tax=Immersiella caudata TaxID=314043 RepID=A0AA40C3V8_9PEZI|nr:hypothetical protein B0T14DRAFT_565388 [Immersiella caudata]
MEEVPLIYRIVCRSVDDRGSFGENLQCRVPSHYAVRRAFRNSKGGLGNAKHFTKLRFALSSPLGFDTLRGFSEVDFKFDLELSVLMMKKEDIWMPLRLQNGLATIGTLYGIGASMMQDLDGICKHLDWNEEYYFLKPKMSKFSSEISQTGLSEDEQKQVLDFRLPALKLLLEEGPIPDAPQRVSKKLNCALFHEVGCQCPESTHWGAVKSCTR